MIHIHITKNKFILISRVHRVVSRVRRVSSRVSSRVSRVSSRMVSVGSIGSRVVSRVVMVMMASTGMPTTIANFCYLRGSV